MSARNSAPLKNRDLDLANRSRKVWLVKVPKYIANKWEKAPGNVEVGKLKISSSPGQRPQLQLTLSDATLNPKDPGYQVISKEHHLDLTTITRQSLGVFSHAVMNIDNVATEKLSAEGSIVQKLECRPNADPNYFKLKCEYIRKATEPQRQVQQLDRVVQKFKPISDHKINTEHQKKKKAEGKKCRDDKEAVLDVLFLAFEKHQYYNIKDLQRITRQPIVYLKEILKEVCLYNMRNPHKNMWELKPEYRHYKEGVSKVQEEKNDSD